MFSILGMVLEESTDYAESCNLRGRPASSDYET